MDELSPTKIIVIHDNIEETSPIMVELSSNHGDENVILFKHSKEGLTYVIDNLGQKMVVLLDKNFYDGKEMDGIKVFEQIREKTSLVYVILITVSKISEINSETLKMLINKDLFKLESFTTDYSKIIMLIEEAIHKLNTRVDSALEHWIALHKESDKEKPYISSRDGKVYTLNEILIEIRNQTPFGMEMEREILLLAIDMLSRGKKKLDGQN